MRSQIPRVRAELRQFCIVTLQFINARAPLPLMESTIEALKTAPKCHLPIGDLLEWTADLKAADIVARDAIAKVSNAATLSEVRAKFWGEANPADLAEGTHPQRRGMLFAQRGG